jgi:ATP-dependent exoDNAse (exonuclease V) alpha subunit
VISAGEWITASGEWVNDRTHGQQYRAKFLKTSEPTSLDGIEKYLGSGMIRGIGPVYAKKLVRAFGEKVFDTIEAEPERLRGVTGIGPDQESLSRSPIWLSMKRKREDEIKPARHPTDSLVHWEALELYMNHLLFLHIISSKC